MILLRNKSLAAKLRTLLGLGALTMAFGLLCIQFGPDLPVNNFISGMSLGLSITFNLIGLWYFGRSRRQSR